MEVSLVAVKVVASTHDGGLMSDDELRSRTSTSRNVIHRHLQAAKRELAEAGANLQWTD